MKLNEIDLEKMAASWLPEAMYPSEMQYLADEILNENVDIFIECGSKDGVSTRQFYQSFANKDIKVISIDFDFSDDLIDAFEKNIIDGSLHLIRGDVHVIVPEIIHTNRNKKIAIVQDAAKGWQGLSTLLAASFYDNVVLIAQHNLQKGHKSRSFFSELSLKEPFLEISGSDLAQDLRKREQATRIAHTTKRPLDHSSLGLININREQRDIFQKRLLSIVKRMGPWNAHITFKKWQTGNLCYVNKLINRQRYMPYRFKKR